MAMPQPPDFPNVLRLKAEECPHPTIQKKKKSSIPELPQDQAISSLQSQATLEASLLHSKKPFINPAQTSAAFHPSRQSSIVCCAV